jgi:hypothetical protein
MYCHVLCMYCHVLSCTVHVLSCTVHVLPRTVHVLPCTDMYCACTVTYCACTAMYCHVLCMYCHVLCMYCHALTCTVHVLPCTVHALSSQALRCFLPPTMQCTKHSGNCAEGCGSQSGVLHPSTHIRQQRMKPWCKLRSFRAGQGRAGRFNAARGAGERGVVPTCS